MWNSSDDSDSPQSTASGRKPGGKPAQSASKGKPSHATLPSHAGSKLPSTFCLGNSESSADSDSSGGKRANSAHGSAKAEVAASVDQTAKPKPGPKTRAARNEALRAQHASGKENKMAPGSKTQSSSQSQNRPAREAKKPGGELEGIAVGRSTDDRAGLSYFEDFPSLGTTLPSKDKKSSKPTTDRNQSGAQKVASLGASSRQCRSFENQNLKAPEMGRGQGYSKREGKLSVMDFILPQNMQHTKQKKKKRGQTAEGSDTFPGSSSDADRKQRPLAATAAMATCAGTRPEANTSSQSKGPQQPRPKKGKGPEVKPKPGSSLRRGQEETSATDDSDDEGLSMFSTIRLGYIPPPRQVDQHAATAGCRTTEDCLFRGTDSGRVPNIACAPDEETVPKQFLGAGPRGQRPRNDPYQVRGYVGRYQVIRNQQDQDGADNLRGNRRDVDRNRRDPGSDDHHNPGQGRRNNPQNRNARHNNNSSMNRVENQNRNIPNNDGVQDDVRAREEDPGARGHREPHRPPPQAEPDQDHIPQDAPAQHPPPDRPAGNRQQHRPPPAGLRPLEANLSFTRLRELKTKQPAEVLAALSYSKEGLSKLLKNEMKLGSDSALLRLLLTALTKTSQCSSMPAQRGEILNMIRTSSFLRLLGTHVSTKSMTDNVTDMVEVIAESADLLRAMLSLFPSCLHDVIMVSAFMDIAQKQVENRGCGALPEGVVHKLDELNIAKDAALEEMMQKESKKKGVVDEDSQTPPDDFRQISVFPTMDDLNKEELPFLRKNKVKGGYTSMDHYLDVQFRLLREDFVFPLREGIAEYLQTIAAPQRNRRLKDIRVYHDVHILRAVCLQSGLGHRLTFDVSRMKGVRWEVTKRLIYGSLVCLSVDNFQTLFFATVVNREPADLREGIVDVIFEHAIQEVSAIPPETTFTMAETTAFFEAYRHVLSGLQRFEENQMPFQKYIVKCEKTVSAPRYLTNPTSATVKYDLRPLVDDSVILREDRNLLEQRREVAYDFSSTSEPANDVPILQREDWPDPNLLHLDSSQFEAVYRALTKEFSVIQGPPGTGKTYVGLKIVKALLHNRACWDPLSSSCMLIVCYTNHALDQFLEGVVDFFSGKVVRVGSRLRSEKLESYSLSNQRWNMRRQREGVDRDFREITRLRFQGHEAMDRLKREMDTMGVKIESAKREILHEEVLMPYMLDRHYDRLLDILQYLEGHGRHGFHSKTKKRMFCMPEWLGIGAVLQNSHMTEEERLHLLEQELGGEDDMEIEGEVQALEEQHRLETDDTVDVNDKQRKEKEKKRALARERSTYLAVDISRLDQGQEGQEQAEGAARGGRGAFQIPRNQWKKIKRKLRRNVQLEDRMNEAEERQVRDLWLLDLPSRWRLYRHWTHKLCQDLKEEMSERERLYDELARRQQETLMQEDKHILKTATVIAMTTTAAARYQSVLQEVKPKVIVVEEAAEVLEGHVITTLSADCEHLILIGDHKQLRPNPTVYALARKYHLELSLFERMINNGLKCVTLGWQHRMRPEIAALVRPIYPELENHPSVEKYEAVKGVCSNVFFINHGHPEVHDEETKSHSNQFEAHYAAMLCRYMLKQGYDPSRITVLTTYSGQLFLLRRLMPKKSIYDGVRVTVVDNFQGEENDIIILSLVRSNDENNIGFLKIENRVCVALSRAKMGLYVIGNFDLLSEESELWKGITTDLRRAGKLGDTLHLYCQNHPDDKGLAVRKPDDFNNAPEGGCMKPCTARLDCGHVCMRMCHPYDQDHKEYKCPKKCERKMHCEFQHPCSKQCYQPCGECMVKVERIMAKCKHRQWLACSVDPNEFICQEECPVMLWCGHPCGDVCGERHRCFERVQYTWPCGHTGQVACADKDSTPCSHPCEKQLSCGHMCSGTCCECHGGRLHQQCSNNCSKILVCGHTCRDMCSNCPPCVHKCENSCVHSTCHKRCGVPCPPCNEPCVWQCPHYSCKKLCHEPCDRPACDEPCPLLLECNHPCIGLCGETCPRLCRVCDAKELTEIFFGTEEEPDARFVELEDCHHVLEVSGLDQWMQTTTDTHEDSIQLKSCPKCKTPIRRNLRYGSVIKTQLQDIETIKAKMQGDDEKRKDTLAEIELMIDDENETSYEGMKRGVLEAGDLDSLAGLVAIKNQMTFLEETKKLKLLKKKKKPVSAAKFSEAMEKFEKWVCKKREVFSDQELQDAQTEMTRLKHWLALDVYMTILARNPSLSIPESLRNDATKTISSMAKGRLETEDDKQRTADLLTQLQELVPDSGLGISEQERVMIVSAMDLSQGHWFKCPEGHIYAIADCGGATMESRCPECNATIGGTQHRLREDNALAPEMDGASAPAWPTALGNLDLDLGLGDLI